MLITEVRVLCFCTLFLCNTCSVSPVYTTGPAAVQAGEGGHTTNAVTASGVGHATGTHRPPQTGLCAALSVCFGLLFAHIRLCDLSISQTH